MRLFLSTIILTAVACCYSAATARAEQFDIISRTITAPGVEQIRIDKPNPTQRATEYPSITFLPGDTVAISAGGCVQSGGHGNTWHRYVNPSGGDSDKYYKGTITIPFATGVLEPIAKYQNQTVVVGAGASPGAHLQLGFLDDDYSDNGYYSHDDGPNDQCKGPDGGPAFVVLTITHNGPTPAPGTGGPWDLLFAQFDENGIPLNPDWRGHNAQAMTFPDPGSCTWPWNGSTPPLCTSQISDTDTYWVCERFSKNFGFGGHANWTAATYNGTVNWEEKSAPGADDEYSVNLVTSNAVGGTGGRTDGVHVEFDSDETIDKLTDNFGLPWWKLFRTAVDGGDTQAHALIDGHDMVVTGLIGVDFAHTPGGESHPAWDVAIHANSDPSDDTWAIFARNWGNEGYCSGDQHYIDYVGNQYAIALKWPQGAVSGTVKSSTFFADGDNEPSMSVTFVPNREVRVAFFGMADPSAQQLIGGELHIAWTMSTPRRFRPPTIVRRTTALRAGQKDAAEVFLAQATGRLSASQRVAYRNALPKPAAVSHKHVRVRMQTTAAARALLRINTRPRIRSVPDTKRMRFKEAQMAALRQAYGGTIPGLPQ